MHIKLGKILKGWVIPLCISVGVVIYIGYSSITLISREELTMNGISSTKRRIIRYAQQHDRLPDTLESLPDIPTYSNRDSLADGWRRPLSYQKDLDNNIIILGSHGEDGIANTSDDIVQTFRIKNEEGDWVDELEEPLSSTTE